MAGECDAASAVLGDANLLLHVLCRLTRRDAACLEVACAATHRAAQHLRASNAPLTYFPRLVVCCSRNSRLVEVPLPLTCCSADTAPTVSCELTAVPARPPPRRSQPLAQQRSSARGPSWPTSLAFSPHDHHLYCCQYMVRGVIRLRASSLRYQKIFVQGRKLDGPEGVTFCGGLLYVVSSVNEAVCQLCPLSGRVTAQCALQLAGEPPASLIGWGMSAWQPPPSAAGGSPPLLLVAVDLAYEPEGGDYTTPPLAAHGLIAAIPVIEEQGFGACHRYSIGSLRRPSGVCVDTAGDVWATCMDQRLVQLAGPCHASAPPGTQLRSISTTHLAANPEFRPYDLAHLALPDGGLLAVTLHGGRRHGPGCVALLRAADGAIVRLVHGEVLKEPNMMAVQVQ